MRTTLGFLLAVAVVGGGAWLFACGSSDDKPVPAVEGTDGSISANDGTVPGSDGGVTPGTDSSSGLDGTTTTDAPPINTDPDGGTTTDAGPGGTTSAITCGATSCAVPGQICCVYDNAGSPTFTFTCVTGATCPQVNGTNDHPPALSCTGFSNCNAGDVCCVKKDNNDDFSATCTPTANCTGQDNAVLCDPKQPDAGCPPSDPCDNNNINDWNLPRGFGTCGGQGN